MHILVFMILLIALVVGPQIWVRRVMERYSSPEDRYDLSGGDAARKMLDDAGLQSVKVESTDLGSADLVAKIIGRVKKFNFGHKEGVSVLTILYPIDFLPAG